MQDVTADVVYGFLHYSKATGNMDYLTKNAAETIIETCRFWMDRIDYIDGKPALLGVMGPMSIILFLIIMPLQTVWLKAH